MKFITAKLGEKEYKLRLTAGAAAEIEEKIGCNLISLFAGITENNVPPLSSMLTILWGALQPLNHGISMKDTYDIYDEFVDNQNTFVDLIKILVDTLKISGFMATDTKSTEKN